MIRIKRGPMIEAYASIFLQKLDFDHDESVDAVLEWVNGYISGPWIEPLASVIEKTERNERTQSLDTFRQWLRHQLLEESRLN